MVSLKSEIGKLVRKISLTTFILLIGTLRRAGLRVRAVRAGEGQPRGEAGVDLPPVRPGRGRRHQQGGDGGRRHVGQCNMIIGEEPPLMELSGQLWY